MTELEDMDLFEQEYDQQVEMHTKEMFEEDGLDNVLPPPLELWVSSADKLLLDKTKKFLWIEPLASFERG